MEWWCAYLDVDEQPLYRPEGIVYGEVEVEFPHEEQLIVQHNVLEAFIKVKTCVATRALSVLRMCAINYYTQSVLYGPP